MLKWTASAQKLNQLTPNIKATTSTLHTPNGLTEAKRRRRRATIANKENVPYTSTPMVARARSSPLVLSPLTDLLNITTKEITPAIEHTPQRIESTQTHAGSQALPNRRHSTVGLFLQSATPSYASTLPRFEEEYSPSAALPTGQQVALRGLLPDPFLSNLRYFNTPELVKRTQKEAQAKLKSTRKSLPRKLDEDFAEIARECSGEQQLQRNNNETHSAGMSDQTLDKLIDAILDSARKDEKKKVKPRRSFNLRRRTLLKNHDAQKDSELVLSPSYAAGDDPASDLSFLFNDPSTKCPSKTSPATPAPATPLPGTPLSDETLRQLPTPDVAAQMPTACGETQLHFLRSSTSKKRLDTTFELETPVRLPMQRKRQRRKTLALPFGVTSKRFKVDGSNYFEVGVALPSIYV
ncbi:uncharacterized protein [Eurosta solidaginis]|uniref:uncharacterized protein n=1 Tax=Eurosta solidaginis TaxID=178769 RepID=UPI003531607A